MKKTLFTLGCAVFAAVGLTCCGGGGETDGEQIRPLCGKTFDFRAPTISGQMIVDIDSVPKDGAPSLANAWIKFGSGASRYPGIVKMVDGSDPLKPIIRVSIDGGYDVTGDDDFQTYFSRFIEDAQEDGDGDLNLQNVPMPVITIQFPRENARDGVYWATFTMEVEDDEGNTTTEDVTDAEAIFYVEY